MEEISISNLIFPDVMLILIFTCFYIVTLLNCLSNIFFKKETQADKNSLALTNHFTFLIVSIGDLILITANLLFRLSVPEEFFHFSTGEITLITLPPVLILTLMNLRTYKWFYIEGYTINSYLFSKESTEGSIMTVNLADFTETDSKVVKSEVKEEISEKESTAVIINPIFEKEKENIEMKINNIRTDFYDILTDEEKHLIDYKILNNLEKIKKELFDDYFSDEIKEMFVDINNVLDNLIEEKKNYKYQLIDNKANMIRELLK